MRGEENQGQTLEQRCCPQPGFNTKAKQQQEVHCVVDWHQQEVKHPKRSDISSARRSSERGGRRRAESRCLAALDGMEELSSEFNRAANTKQPFHQQVHSIPRLSTHVEYQFHTFIVPLSALEKFPHSSCVCEHATKRGWAGMWQQRRPQSQHVHGAVASG